jgi:DNA polymerase-3 subunit beta
MDTLRYLPEQPITFSIDEETNVIEMSSDSGHYKLAGESAADFPRIPEVSGGHSVDISSDAMATAISKTIFATSNDELRQAMTGVFVQFSETNTTFVATDGHRLVRYRRVDVTADEDYSLIIPRKAFNLLKNALPPNDTNVVIEFNPSNAFFHFGNIRMICRLIDERYPEYNNVIPLNNDNHMTIDRMEFLSSLRRISTYANKTTYQVRLKITGSELQISAEDLDFQSEADERLSCEHDGEDIEIGFNAKLVMEMLNNLESEKIVLQLSEPNRAGLIVPVDQGDNEDILMLVMPVMLSNYA